MPNPNSGTFLLRLSGDPASASHVTISDQLGKLVWENTLTNGSDHQIDLPFAKGIYTVFVRNNEKWKVEKVIIQ